jgi:hypothetical protein
MRAGFWLAAALAVTGLVVAGVWALLAFTAFNQHIDQFARTTAPGQTTVSISQPGTGIVYYEYPRGTTPTDVTVTIIDPSGKQVDLKQVGYNLTYDVPSQNGRVGEAVLQFRAETAGPYVLQVEGDVPAARIAVGDNIAGYVVRSILGIVGVAVVTGGAAVTLVVVTAVKRARFARPSVTSAASVAV